MIMSGDNYAEIMRLVAQTETNLQKYLGINMLAYCVDTCLTQPRQHAVWPLQSDADFKAYPIEDTSMMPWFEENVQ